MPWAKRATVRNSGVTSRETTYSIDNYSDGYNSFVGNDLFPLVNGSANMWRLAQDARITTLGQYQTRKGFDFHSVAVGQTQDQAITSVTGASDKSFNTVTRLAQKFTTASAGALTRLDINLKNAASATGTIVIGIYTDNAGSPGTLLATTSTDPSTITSSYNYSTFRFASAPTLINTTTYWIVAYVQAIGSGSYSWSGTTSATTAVVSTDSGMTWSSTSYALNFKQYYSTVNGPKGMFRAYKSDGTKVTLFAHNTTLYSVDNSTGVLTAVKTGLSSSAVRYRFIKVNDIIYYVNGFDGYRKWDFTTESQVNATNYTLICSHKGLVFLAGGADPNAIFFSNFGLYETFTSTDFIYADAPKTGDPVRALISLNGSLIIPTQNSKFILSGDNNATFSITTAPDRKGTYTQETICQDDNYIYYLSDDGVYRSNGSQAQIMSNNIYQDILTLANKGNAVLCRNKGRLYMWYTSAGASVNDSCIVWNINFSSTGQSETVESHDTNAYVSFAVNAYQDNDDMLVASSIVGQVYWQEKDSNDYNNLGGPINFLLQTHYMVFSLRLRYMTIGGPSVLKAVRFWTPRFAAQSGNYTVDCDYAYDIRDNWQTQNSLNVQGSGPIWGSGSMIWGSFIWGSTAEVHKQMYIPGEYYRTAVRYKHFAIRQPNTFLGHLLVVQMRKLHS